MATHFRTPLLAAAFALAAPLTGCQPKQQEETAGVIPAPAPAAAAPGAASGAGSTDSVGATAASPAAASPKPAAQQQQQQQQASQHVHPAGPGAPNIALSAIAGSSSYVGQRVHVTGRCLGYSNAATLGPPPLTRSDWQLQSSGSTIFVSGPLPAGCSATEGGSAPVTVLVRVAEDTLPALGGKAGTPRRYLVLIRE